MKKILLIGSNSDISKALIFENSTEFDFIQISSSNSAFNILDNKTFPEQNNVDGLVYFPGTINLKPFTNLKEDDFQRDYEINVLGLINVLQFYHKSFNQNSSIVTISTIAASFGMPFHTSISMCKSSVEALTKSLAAEWAPKIRLNCIAPSLIATKMSERLINSELKKNKISEKHPLKKIGEISDISNMISFLLSEKSKWMTGQIIRLDGGLSNIR
ncbi:MAG: oxidoreductase [Flavobacteriales bacterium]|jgi:3-oxoacyl-[acyl-carrier protein] reductase|nr:oxidoreductase [Flavobacteriales bacterium]